MSQYIRKQAKEKGMKEMAKEFRKQGEIYISKKNSLLGE
jgi:hypothetical protein